MDGGGAGQVIRARIGAPAAMAPGAEMDFSGRRSRFLVDGTDLAGRTMQLLSPVRRSHQGPGEVLKSAPATPAGGKEDSMSSSHAGRTCRPPSLRLVLSAL